MRVVVGITGASGAIYGYSLVRLLAEKGVETKVILTDMGKKVLQYECGIDWQELASYAEIFENDDLFACVASGSYRVDGMAVIPCSMNTLGAIANGMGDTLLDRCASVALKEGHKLVLVVRETPYSIIHMENMLKAARAGACIMPASPGFYHRPTQIWELVDGIDRRVLDQLGIKDEEAKRWGDEKP